MWGSPRPAESPDAPRRASNGARAPLPIAGHHRLLVKSGGAVSDARIHVERGRLAGTQIHLVAVGARVDAHALTPHEASRQTLVIAMEAARRRLRERGLVLAGASSTPDHRRDRARAQADGDEPAAF